jgi:hypothetical protein
VSATVYGPLKWPQEGQEVSVLTSFGVVTGVCEGPTDDGEGFVVADVLIHATELRQWVKL